jgi:phosphotransferase system enzyme I (PtsI)
MIRLVGRGVAGGVAVGRALVAVRDARLVRYRLASSGVERERGRLRAARARTKQELEEISARVSRTVGSAQAAMFAAQILMLDDPHLAARADELVRSERINADWALDRAIEEIDVALAREGDAWVRERVSDLADVGGRVRRNLRPERDPLVQLVQDLEPPLVLVADDLPPSTAAQLDWDRVSGLVCDVGSPTHHTVILARSIGVPTVVGLGRATDVIAPGRMVAVDGETGEVLIDPTEDILSRWRRRADAAAVSRRALAQLKSQPAATRDGLRIRLEANLEIADEVERVREVGAEGIGLYRSEFLLDPDAGELSEDAQFAVYRDLLQAMAPLPVTIRTFDAGEGGDAGGHRERFGVRGIRAGLQHDSRFARQIRALLRAASAGHLRILLPFVTSAEELRAARGLIDDLAAALGVETRVPVGAMIEVPAAALTVDHLAAHADFLSVGTNDLIQYTLAIDRTDERLAGRYEPSEPAVLRLLRMIALAGRKSRCDLSVCGETAADPHFVPLLIGLGFRTLSMTASAIPVVKRALASLDSQDARRAARQALAAATVDDVKAALAPLAAIWREAAESSPDVGETHE